MTACFSAWIRSTSPRDPGEHFPSPACRPILKGDRIDPKRHELSADVKAVTLYRGRIEAVQDGWEAEVALDV